MTNSKLPKLKHPIFEVTLPTSKVKLSCRPWLVQEDRILLGAKESNTVEDIALAVQQTMRNCVLDVDFDIASLCSLDMDYLFLKVRGATVGNIVKPTYECNNVVKDEETGEERECKGDFEFVLDLTKIGPDKPLVKSFEEVPLTDEYNVKFRYPLFDALRNLKAEDNEFVESTKKIMAVVDYIVSSKDKDAEPISFDGESVENVIEFLNGLTSSQFDVLNKFIEDLPVISLDATAKCPRCGYEHVGNFKNLASFF